MPISAPSYGDDDQSDPRFRSEDLYETESLECPGLSAARAEKVLKKLGAGVVDKHELVEGIGWKARIEEVGDGVSVHFRAHDELLDDLLRRFELQAERELQG
jgi:hypothetical protein